jgi:hypothetical protein
MKDGGGARSTHVAEGSSSASVLPGARSKEAIVTLIRVTNAELRRLASDATPETPRWLALQRRAAILYGINLLLLLSVLWAMVFKPTL